MPLPPYNWSPQIPIGISMGLVGLAALLCLWWIARSRAVVRVGWRFPVFLCRAAVLTLLLFILLNPVERDVAEGSEGGTVILVDASASMGLEAPQTRLAQALEWVNPLLEATGDGFPPRVVLFDDALRPPGDLKAQRADGTRTNLSAALREVMDGAGSNPLAGIIVVSDGLAQDREDLPATLERATARKTKIFTHTIGVDLPPRNAWLQDLYVQRSARPDTRVPVEVVVRTLAFEQGTPLELTLSNEAGEILARTGVAAATDPVPTKLFLTSGLRTQDFTLRLSETAGEITTEDNHLAFTLEVRSPKIRVLNMEGSHRRREYITDAGIVHWNDIEIMNRALEATGEIEVDTMSAITQYANGPNLHFVNGFADGCFLFNQARGFPGTRKDLFKYDVIICSDIPKGNFRPDELEWVVELVTQRGGGFVMIGGNTAFDSGSWDQTAWEKITPVDMLNYGQGHTRRFITATVPPAVRDHPIWRILPDSNANRALLDAHPPFHGFHDIRRAKPGATVLAVRGDGGGPLIAVQTYGRGRSMAFLSDANGTWGKTYNRWGPPDNSITVGRQEELGHGPKILRGAPQGFRASEAPQLDHHPAEYYGRFWVNTVKWLAENSIRQQREDLIGRVRTTTVRPGQTVELSAEVFAALSPAELPNLIVQARLSTPGAERHSLEWSRGRREFVGELQVPENLPGSQIDVVFDTSVNGEPISDQIRLGVLRLSPEHEVTEPDHQFMADLAEVSQGQVVGTAAEAINALRASIAEAQTIEEAFTRPEWDHPSIWALLVGLLGLEWTMRRLGGRLASA